MPKKNLFGLSGDSRGRWRRQNFGAWSDGGKPTFILGTDYAEACKRALVLDKVWEAVQGDWYRRKDTPFAAWDDQTYPIALAVCRGETEIKLDVPPSVEETAAELEDGDEFVALWLKALQQQFPFLALSLTQQERQQQGTEKLEAWANRLGGFAAKVLSPQSSQMLYAALKSYTVWTTAKYTTEGKLSQFGRLVLRRVESIQQHQADVPLSQVDAPFLENWFLTWAKRPRTKRGQPCAVDTAKGVIKTLRDFLRWLHRSKEFDWRQPQDWQDLPVKVQIRAEELVHQDVKPRYSRDEVARLYEYSKGVERLYLLLGLNCGFGGAEIATLKLAEIDLDKGRISRQRTKTNTPGKWPLWEATLAGIKWYLANVRPQSPSPFLFVRKSGADLRNETTGNNRNSAVASTWSRTLDRVRKDFPEFKRLSFGKLRKTSASWVRKLADKEVADLFLGHGRREMVDHYTERRYGAVSKTVRRIGRKLAPVFSAVPDPFPVFNGKKAVSNCSVTPGQIKRMQELRGAGKKLKEVAAELDVSVATVMKYTNK